MYKDLHFVTPKNKIGDFTYAFQQSIIYSWMILHIHSWAALWIQMNLSVKFVYM